MSAFESTSLPPPCGRPLLIVPYHACAHPFQVFEAEKMITKRGWYHKKCFACCKCKTQLDYFNCIEGPDDDIYCKVCYLRFWGPGQSHIRMVTTSQLT